MTELVWIHIENTLEIWVAEVDGHLATVSADRLSSAWWAELHEPSGRRRVTYQRSRAEAQAWCEQELARRH